MPSNGGLKGHEEIIVDILRTLRCRSSSKEESEHGEEGRNLRDARKILSSQDALIARLKSIETELKSTSQ